MEVRPNTTITKTATAATQLRLPGSLDIMIYSSSVFDLSQKDQLSRLDKKIREKRRSIIPPHIIFFIVTLIDKNGNSFWTHCPECPRGCIHFHIRAL